MVYFTVTDQMVPGRSRLRVQEDKVYTSVEAKWLVAWSIMQLRFKEEPNKTKGVVKIPRDPKVLKVRTY